MCAHTRNLIWLLIIFIGKSDLELGGLGPCYSAFEVNRFFFLFIWIFLFVDSQFQLFRCRCMELRWMHRCYSEKSKAENRMWVLIFPSWQPCCLLDTDTDTDMELLNQNLVFNPRYYCFVAMLHATNCASRVLLAVNNRPWQETYVTDLLELDSLVYVLLTLSIHFLLCHRKSTNGGWEHRNGNNYFKNHSHYISPKKLHLVYQQKVFGCYIHGCLGRVW